jgi:hypothetical protein
MAPAMEEVLIAFLSPDNEIRRQAELHIAAGKADKDALSTQLLGALRSSARPEARQASAVILRKLFTNEAGFWDGITAPTKQAIMQELLNVLQVEPLRVVRHGTCDLVAQIASELMGMGGEDSGPTSGAAAWPQLWAFVRAAVSAPSPDAQETAFILVERLGYHIAVHMQAHLPTFRDLFTARIADTSAPSSLRMAAARAAIAVLMFVQTLEERRALSVVLHPIISNLQAAAASGDDEMSETMAGLLVEAANDEDIAPMFRPFLAEAVKMLAHMVASVGLHNAMRLNCLEALLCLAEQAPTLVRKLSPKGAFLSIVLPVVFQLAQEWGEQESGWEAEWEVGDEETDEGEEGAEGCNVDAGQGALARLCEALPKGFRDPFLHEVQLLLGPGNEGPNAWCRRQAAMAALAECADVIDDVAEQQRTAATTLSHKMTADSHPRVRYAAVQALTSLLHSQSPMFQERTHKISMPAIIKGLGDASMRVRAASCIAVCAYTNALDELDCQTSLEPHITPLMHALVASLNAGGAGANAAQRRLREASITAVASVGASMGARAGEFYDALRGGLFSLLNAVEPVAPSVPLEDRTAHTQYERNLHHVRLMKGKALECLGVLGEATGKEKFEADGRACLVGVVGMLQTFQAQAAAAVIAAGAGAMPTHPSASDNPVQSYIWDTIGRLGRVLGPAEIAPYLPSILPPLFAAADAKTTEVVTEEDAEEEEEEEEEEGGDDSRRTVLAQTSSGTVIKVRTADLDDKTSALTALSSMFTSMNRASRKAGGGIMISPSAMANAGPAMLYICRKVLKESGTPLDEIKVTAADALDDVFAAMASALHAEAVCAAALDLSTHYAGGALPSADLPASLAGSAPHVYVQTLVSTALALTSALKEETSMEILVVLVKAFKAVLCKACVRSGFLREAPFHELPLDARYLPLIPAVAIMPMLKSHLMVALQEAMQRRAVRAAEAKVKASEDEIDEEEAEVMESRNDDDLHLMAFITEALGAVLKVAGRPDLVLASVLPAAVTRAAELSAWPSFTASVLQRYSDWLHPACLARDRGNAVYLIVDVLEFVGEAAILPDGSSAVPQMFGAIVSALAGGPNPEPAATRQAAAYGLGAVAGRLVPFWPAVLNGAMAGLAALIREGLADGEGGRDASFDTAAASLAAVLVKSYPTAAAEASRLPGFVPRASALGALFDVLPLVEDDVEAKNMAELLVTLLVGCDGEAFGSWDGPGVARLGSTIHQFTTVLERIEGLDGDGPHTADEAMKRGIVACLQWLRSPVSGVPAAVFAAAAAMLPADQLEVLELVFTPASP